MIAGPVVAIAIALPLALKATAPPEPTAAEVTQTKLVADMSTKLDKVVHAVEDRPDCTNHPTKGD